MSPPGDLFDVVVVGAGPAGLAAASELRHRGVERVLVVERESEPGGIPRHTDHTGFGWNEHHRLMAGPAYAARIAAEAARRGAEIRLSSTVLDVGHFHDGAIPLTVATAAGAEHLRTRSVLLATGVRERPRAARLVPGDRPAGVLTTGSLQQLVRAGAPIGTRAVVVGAEHVSFSAVTTLAGAGCRTAAMVTPFSGHQTYRSLAWATAGRRRVPVHAGIAVAEIVGRGRVESVLLDDGRRIECDTVVFTGDWIPDHELARRTGLEIDGGTRGPRVDGGLRTSERGVFAAGNLLHGAETAGVCARDGLHVASSIARWLDGDDWPTAIVPLIVTEPLVWISPGAITTSPSTTPNMSTPPVAPPRDRFLLRVSTDLPRRAKVVVRQGDRTLWRGAPGGHARPNRSCWIPASWVGAVEPTASLPVVAGVA